MQTNKSMSDAFHACDDQPLHVGQWVVNANAPHWGIGQVVTSDDQETTVEFVKNGRKTFIHCLALQLIDTPLDKSGRQLTLADVAKREEERIHTQKQEASQQRWLDRPQLTEEETAQVIRQANKNDQHEGGRYR